LLVLTIGLSACASFDRDGRSGYGGTNEAYSRTEDFYNERASKEEVEAREELGLPNRALSDSESQKLDERLRLHRMEAKLESKRDRKQYFAVRNLMRSDREREGFLSLPSYEAKQRWLQNRGLLKEETSYTEPVAKAIEENDITVGMSPKAVKESWGDPDIVETAGDPMYGYERWNYHRFVAGNEGYQKENRIVYFEGGRVVGWETANN
jgi:hypothetical protein